MSESTQTSRGEEPMHYPHAACTRPADGGYAGKLVTWVATVLQRTLVIVKRPRHTQGFQVVQWRWIAERTFGWLNRSRRLSKDFEALPETTETWIRIAMIHLMVRRLAAST
jgi:putative transposase